MRTVLQIVAVTALLLGSRPAAPAQEKPWEVYGNTRTSSSAPAPEDRVDINHASLNQLLKVPGMTKVWAGRIVRFRPYRTKQNLVDRGVITPAVYDRIKDYIIAHREKQ